MWKKGRNSYCLVCKMITDNKKIKALALVNKIATQRSLYAVCTSRKSTFWKQIKPITNKTNKKQK